MGGVYKKRGGGGGEINRIQATAIEAIAGTDYTKDISPAALKAALDEMFFFKNSQINGLTVIQDVYSGGNLLFASPVDQTVKIPAGLKSGFNFVLSSANTAGLAGLPTVVGAAGVTIKNKDAQFKLSASGASVALIPYGNFADQYLLIGSTQ